MAVLKQRPKMVTFRVSWEEHEALTKSCMESGARSIADFARAAVLQKVQSMHTPGGSLAGDLTTLSKGLRELDIGLANVRKRIRDILGPAGSRLSGPNDSPPVVERHDNVAI
jgi:hypothetical protein